MTDILVLGIGSRLMMDDGIGLYLVEDLKQFFKEPGIEFLCGETDMDYSVSMIERSQTIVIVDAFFSGRDPGEVTVIPLEDLEVKPGTGYSMHGNHVLGLLKCLRHQPDGILIGIEPYEINFGFELSGALHNGYDRILKTVREKLDQYVKAFGGRKHA